MTQANEKGGVHFFCKGRGFCFSVIVLIGFSCQSLWIWSDRCVPLIFDVEECAVYHRVFLASGCFEEP